MEVGLKPKVLSDLLTSGEMDSCPEDGNRSERPDYEHSIAGSAF
jgi:hypothetical protein